jgi:hypothetical protein
MSQQIGGKWFNHPSQSEITQSEITQSEITQSEITPFSSLECFHH